MSGIVSATASAAHSAAASLLSASPIKVGDQLPAVKVKETSPTESFEIHNIPGKIVIVGVPAAFSPSCSTQVPGYIEHFEAFKAKGVKEIFVVSVNDTFVQQAWKEKLASGGTSVRFISDDSGEFVSKLGLIFDAQAFLGGPRAKRFTIVAENGKVTHLVVETSPPEVTVTKAESVLATL